MTNEQIILFNRIQLMKDGVIGTTGNQICLEDEDGNKEVIYEPEQIHTFNERAYRCGVTTLIEVRQLLVLVYRIRIMA